MRVPLLALTLLALSSGLTYGEDELLEVLAVVDDTVYARSPGAGPYEPRELPELADAVFEGRGRYRVAPPRDGANLDLAAVIHGAARRVAMVPWLGADNPALLEARQTAIADSTGRGVHTLRLLSEGFIAGRTSMTAQVDYLEAELPQRVTSSLDAGYLYPGDGIDTEFTRLRVVTPDVTWETGTVIRVERRWYRNAGAALNGAHALANPDLQTATTEDAWTLVRDRDQPARLVAQSGSQVLVLEANRPVRLRTLFRLATAKVAFTRPTFISYVHGSSRWIVLPPQLDVAWKELYSPPESDQDVEGYERYQAVSQHGSGGSTFLRAYGRRDRRDVEKLVYALGYGTDPFGESRDDAKTQEELPPQPLTKEPLQAENREESAPQRGLADLVPGAH